MEWISSEIGFMNDDIEREPRGVFGTIDLVPYVGTAKQNSAVPPPALPCPVPPSQRETKEESFATHARD